MLHSSQKKEKVFLHPKTMADEDSMLFPLTSEGDETPDGGVMTFDEFRASHLNPIQTRNWNRIMAVATKAVPPNGFQFDRVVYRWVGGDGEDGDDRRRRLSFVANSFPTTGDAVVVQWKKYEGPTAGSGQNTIKIGNQKRMQLTRFLKMYE
jgi:hypothetical protein